MQTRIQVYSKNGKSLGDIVVNDRKLGDFGLSVSEFKRQGRPHGWAKLHKPGAAGAVNMEWHASAQLLICRVVTRGGNPDEITAAPVQFVIARASKRIRAIHIVPSQ